MKSIPYRGLLLTLLLVVLFCKAQTQKAGGLIFEGVNDHVIVPHHSKVDFGSNPFTIEVWVNWKYTSGLVGCILCTASNSSGHMNLGILTNGHIWFEVTTSQYAISSIGISRNTWHHIAAVRTGNGPIIYLDGNIIPITIASQFIASLSDSIPAVIGNPGFCGQIDELRIWNRPLHKSHIVPNMSQELIGNESGLVTYFNFNNCDAIAYGSNVGVDSLFDLSIIPTNGSLYSFDFTDSLSNWSNGFLSSSKCASSLNVPAISEWSMLILALLFCILGVLALMRRKPQKLMD